MVQQVLIGGFDQIIEKKKPLMARILLDAQFVGVKCPSCHCDVFCAHAVLGSTFYFLHTCINLNCKLECFSQRENYSANSCPLCSRNIKRRDKNGED